MAFKDRYIIWQLGIAFSFLTFINLINCHDIKCTPGLSTPGYTWPHGDIIIEYGNPLDIWCTLYDKVAEELGPDAVKSLHFYQDSHRLPDDMSEIINTTTIKLHIEKPPKVKRDFYSCILEAPLRENSNSTVCSNIVFVGHKPLPIEDFKCIGYNYDNLTCTFTPPENYVKTDYHLSYSLRQRVPNQMQCPNLTYIEETNKMECVWSVYSTPQYRQAHEEFLFHLHGNNTFGEINYNETFMHYRHVLPNPPDNLSVESKTISSIYLSWHVPQRMESFPPGVHHRVLYQCQYGPKTWKLAALITDLPKVNKIFYNLTNIEHPNIFCDIRVSIRSAQALFSNESMWSGNASLTESTLSTIPSEPPATNIGSYELISQYGNLMEYRDAYIFWRQIPDEERNGPEFRYDVRVENNSTMRYTELTGTYAKFENLSITSEYIFNVWSVNVNGTSKKKSVVRVPRTVNRVAEPKSFTQVEFENGVYELSWEAPNVKHGKPLTNYTLFWCKSVRDRAYQCNGKLDWITIPPSATYYNITLEKNRVYQFAISANTEDSSSGMLWATCFVVHKKSVGKLKNIWVNNVGSDFIMLEWKLDCSNRIGTIDGYLIYYCPIKAPSEPSCMGSQSLNLTVTGDVTTAAVRSLKPYTTYMFTVSVKTRHATSLPSEPLFYTTFEAAPSTPPQNFRYEDVTNSSVLLKWDPPVAMNGILKYNILTVNHREYPRLDPGYEYLLTDLETYKTYTMSIKACTVSCSDSTPPISVTTKMGYPGVIRKPSIDMQNKTLTVITWSKPSPAGGNVDFYEVNFKQVYDGVNRTLPIFNVTEPKYNIENCGENGKYNSFYISVRAINIVEGKLLEGPWSDTLEAYCTTTPNYMIYLIIFSSCIFAVLMFYLSKRLYQKCKVMSNVEVKLPSGLDPVTVSNHTLAQWGTEKSSEGHSHSPPDQEMLLAKISDVRHQSGDSSGCSSGQESVTSSLQSRSHISNSSDSGTEQPRSPSDDERRNSLRLRNVPTSRPNNKGYVVMPPDPVNLQTRSPKVQLPGSYCVVGDDPNASFDLDIPYVATSLDFEDIKVPCDLDDGVSPTPSLCTVSGNLIKSVNPGYVPYREDSPESSPAYVVAGNKNMMPDLLNNEPIKILQKEDSKTSCIPDSGAILKPMNNLEWQTSALDDMAVNKTGYVTVGDIKPPLKPATELSKGYVPHRQFEVKSLKED